jgi:hypothetical protein
MAPLPPSYRASPHAGLAVVAHEALPCILPEDRLERVVEQEEDNENDRKCIKGEMRKMIAGEEISQPCKPGEARESGIRAPEGVGNGIIKAADRGRAINKIRIQIEGVSG